ncbi:MAG: hypothetical protein MJ184_11570 [Treponema sp.]|uniref:hypothetical protein n=1 Tax=Treponema sp. TaxID=166 RepID=UPI00298E84DE|nr:hypothetical protein [Treponema sp.]MCQ2593450.1 hypothetical protein [Treponema sp.]MCQ2601987.1 hypothetical protein [Treponema sp.]
MNRLFENHRQERIIKILKMIKEGKIVNTSTVGDLGVSITALSKDFKAIMYDIGLPIVYDAKIHSYVATEDFEIPWRVVNDEIAELLEQSKKDLQELIKEDSDNMKLKQILENLKGIEKLNSEKLCLIEK